MKNKLEEKKEKMAKKMKFTKGSVAAKHRGIKMSKESNSAYEAMEREQDEANERNK